MVPVDRASMSCHTPHMATDAPKTRVTITIDPALLQRIDAVCEAMGSPRSSMIELMIEQGIDRREGLVRDMENPMLRLLARALSTQPKMVTGILQMLGDQIDEEDEEWVRSGLREQIERGKKRQADKQADRKRLVEEG